MSKAIKIIGTLILAIVVIAAVLIVVPKLSQKSTPSDGTLTSTRTTSNEALPVSQDLLAILQSVNSITLKDSVLKDPAFQSLVDISLSIQRTDTEGRVNPFADLRTFVPITVNSALISTTPTPAAVQ